jgi:phosphoesterase RecJ-like protein
MKFGKEFKSIKYIIENSNSILLFAHSGPDGDTSGATMALYHYIKKIGKKVDVACFDVVPEYLKEIVSYDFKNPEKIDLGSYDSVIAADSVERGFEKIRDNFSENQAIIILDHHPDITMKGDVEVIDATYSSVSEIVFDYFEFFGIRIDSKIATLLLMGILADTGKLQHSNTNPKVMHAAAELLNRGALVSKIFKTISSGNNFSTLKIWGKALEKAKINPKTGMIVTAITKKDLEECNASHEDTSEISSILNTVPETSFSLVLSERNDGVVKGSLRSEKYKGVDVSEIAHKFGGGGHKLASGFEIKGKIKETKDGWEVV